MVLPSPIAFVHSELRCDAHQVCSVSLHAIAATQSSTFSDESPRDPRYSGRVFKFTVRNNP
jgi:hypothetical protein